MLCELWWSPFRLHHTGRVVPFSSKPLPGKVGSATGSSVISTSADLWSCGCFRPPHTTTARMTLATARMTAVTTNPTISPDMSPLTGASSSSSWARALTTAEMLSESPPANTVRSSCSRAFSSLILLRYVVHISLSRSLRSSLKVSSQSLMVCHQAAGDRTGLFSLELRQSLQNLPLSCLGHHLQFH